MPDSSFSEVSVPTVDRERLISHLKETLENARRDRSLISQPHGSGPSIDSRAAADQERFQRCERLLALVLENTKVTTRWRKFLHWWDPARRQQDLLLLEMLTNLFESYREVAYEMIEVLQANEGLRKLLAVQQLTLCERLDAVVDQLQGSPNAPVDRL